MTSIKNIINNRTTAITTNRVNDNINYNFPNKVIELEIVTIITRFENYYNLTVKLNDGIIIYCSQFSYKDNSLLNDTLKMRVIQNDYFLKVCSYIKNDINKHFELMSKAL